MILNVYIHNIIGLIGVGLVLLAYYLLQTQRITPNTLIYSLMNFLGAIFILFSLFFHWNLSAVVVQIFWILISLIGLYKVLKQKL